MNKVLQAFSMSFGLLILSGCSHLQTQNDKTQAELEPSWQTHLAKIEQINNWSMHGQISIQSKSESFSGQIKWDNEQDNYNIRVSGAFGQGQMTIKGNQKNVTVYHGTKVAAKGVPAIVVKEQTGLPFPVTDIQYWVKGAKHPKKPFTKTLNQNGQLERLKQSSWKIKYPKYKSFDAVDMPKTIELFNSEIKVKIAVRTWEISKETELKASLSNASSEAAF